MKFTITIVRRKDSGSPPYRQTVPYETENLSETVATALTAINEMPDICDVEGNHVGEIRWECSCLQKKCGACAMIINGKPRLACDSFLWNYAKKGKIVLEPLSKFPVVADLIVDRSFMYENLKTMGVWGRKSADLREENADSAFEASKCLQCGLCLEVCPNFVNGGQFAGSAAFVPSARILLSAEVGDNRELSQEYRKHVYEGCGKSLACRDVCPAGIDMDHLLSRSNAAAVWRRSPFKKADF